jgi:hypothetical protein
MVGRVSIRTVRPGTSPQNFSTVALAIMASFAGLRPRADRVAVFPTPERNISDGM